MKKFLPVLLFIVLLINIIPQERELKRPKGSMEGSCRRIEYIEKEDMPNDTLYVKWKKLNGPYGGVISGLVAKGDTVLAGTYEKGCIYYSTDRGENWKRADFKAKDRVTDFVFMEDGSVIAAADNSGLFRSYDLKTWTQIGKNKKYWSLGRDLTGGLYAGIESANGIYSTNNGQSWSVINNSTMIWSFTVTDSNTVLGGCSGSICRKEYGHGFEKVELDSAVHDLPISMSKGKNNKVYALPTGIKYFYVSTDDGRSWTNHDTSSILSKMSSSDLCYNNGDIIVGASTDPFPSYPGWGIALSSDDGYTWEKSNAGLIPESDVSEMDASNGTVYAGLWGGGVYKSTNSGRSWISASKNLSAAYINQFVIDKKGNIYSAVWGNGMSKSTDKGETWELINKGLEYPTMYSVTADDSGYIYAGSGDENQEALFKSTDEGRTWTKISDMFPFYLYTDKENRIYAITYGRGIKRSSDQGKSWVTLNSGLGNWFTFGFAIDSGGNLYTGTRNGTIYKSTNDGQSWNVIRGSTGDYDVVSSIYVADVNTIYASNIGEGILKSTDSGQTWVLKNEGLKGVDVNPVIEDKEGRLYTGSSQGYIYVSTDKGEHWTNIQGDLQYLSTFDMELDENGKLYIGTDESMFMLDTMYVTGINGRNAALNNYVLKQNYPNPFNPSTTIRYSIEKTGRVKINVYNTLGQLIETLLDEIKTQGEYSINYSAKNLSSGVYFYSIDSGNYHQTKKMILLK